MSLSSDIIALVKDNETDTETLRSKIKRCHKSECLDIWVVLATDTYHHGSRYLHTYPKNALALVQLLDRLGIAFLLEGRSISELPITLYTLCSVTTTEAFQENMDRSIVECWVHNTGKNAGACFRVLVNMWQEGIPYNATAPLWQGTWHSMGNGECAALFRELLSRLIHSLGKEQETTEDQRQARRHILIALRRVMHNHRDVERVMCRAWEGCGHTGAARERSRMISVGKDLIRREMLWPMLRVMVQNDASAMVRASIWRDPCWGPGNDDDEEDDDEEGESEGEDRIRKEMILIALQSCRKDPHATVRCAAMDFLVQGSTKMEEEEYYAMLQERICDREASVRRRAMVHIMDRCLRDGGKTSQIACETLRRGLKDCDVKVRQSSIKYLKHLLMDADPGSAGDVLSEVCWQRTEDLLDHTVEECVFAIMEAST